MVGPQTTGASGRVSIQGDKHGCDGYFEPRSTFPE
jgi:hypothetical protein